MKNTLKKILLGMLLITVGSVQSMNAVYDRPTTYKANAGRYIGTYSLDGDSLDQEIAKCHDDPASVILYREQSNLFYKISIPDLNQLVANGLLTYELHSSYEEADSVWADINKGDNDGMTPLMYAVITDSIEVVQYLLEAGADVNATDYHGMTPLMYAYSIEVAQLLLEAGADVNATNNNGYTALMHAVRIYSIEFVELFLENGADVNAKDNRGRTPLMFAYSIEVAQLLLEAGADINIEDNIGQTALDFALARRNQNPNIIKILLAYSQN